MSESNLLSFDDLLGLTFEDGTVHVRHLQILFKILVKQLKLDNVQVSFEDHNLLSTNFVRLSKKSNEMLSVSSHAKPQVKLDPVLKIVPTTDALMKNVCNTDSNTLVDMLDLLNLTKRVEAVEVSFAKMTSLMESMLKRQTVIENEIHELKIQPEKENPSDNLPEHENLSQKSSGSCEDLLSLKSNGSIKSSLIALESSHKSSFAVPKESSHKSSFFVESSTQKVNQEEIENIKQQIAEGTKLFMEKFEVIEKNICELQKTSTDLQEQIDDVMFANEQNDLKIDETLREVNGLDSKLLCLKTDVKTLLEASIEFKKNFVEMDYKYEALNNVKTNKSYVDEICAQKAYKSDLEKFVHYEDFDPVRDILYLKLSLLEENLTKLQLNMKKHLACLKFDIDGKLDKSELCKFKTQVSSFFESFLQELKALLLEIMKSSVTSGGSIKLSPELNCISCESKVSMKTSDMSIPRLQPMSARFSHKLEKSCKKEKPRSDFRILLGEEKNAQQTKTHGCSQYRNLLSFPNTQQCFIISKDNTIVRADPLKCLNNEKYLKN